MQCISCADPLLSSVRRSGRRRIDPLLPVDEVLLRPLSEGSLLGGSVPFGSQDGSSAYTAAEPYILITDIAAKERSGINDGAWSPSEACLAAQELEAEEFADASASFGGALNGSLSGDGPEGSSAILHLSVWSDQSDSAPAAELRRYALSCALPPERDSYFGFGAEAGLSRVAVGPSAALVYLISQLPTLVASYSAPTSGSKNRSILTNSAFVASVLTTGAGATRQAAQEASRGAATTVLRALSSLLISLLNDTALVTAAASFVAAGQSGAGSTIQPFSEVKLSDAEDASFEAAGIRQSYYGSVLELPVVGAIVGSPLCPTLYAPTLAWDGGAETTDGEGGMPKNQRAFEGLYDASGANSSLTMTWAELSAALAASQSGAPLNSSAFLRRPNGITQDYGNEGGQLVALLNVSTTPMSVALPAFAQTSGLETVGLGDLSAALASLILNYSTYLMQDMTNLGLDSSCVDAAKRSGSRYFYGGGARDASLGPHATLAAAIGRLLTYNISVSLQDFSMGANLLENCTNIVLASTPAPAAVTVGGGGGSLPSSATLSAAQSLCPFSVSIGSGGSAFVPGAAALVSSISAASGLASNGSLSTLLHPRMNRLLIQVEEKLPGSPAPPIIPLLNASSFACDQGVALSALTLGQQRSSLVNPGLLSWLPAASPALIAQSTIVSKSFKPWTDSVGGKGNSANSSSLWQALLAVTSLLVQDASLPPFSTTLPSFSGCSGALAIAIGSLAGLQNASIVGGKTASSFVNVGFVSAGSLLVPSLLECLSDPAASSIDLVKSNSALQALFAGLQPMLSSLAGGSTTLNASSSSDLLAAGASSPQIAAQYFAGIDLAYGDSFSAAYKVGGFLPMAATSVSQHYPSSSEFADTLLDCAASASMIAGNLSYLNSSADCSNVKALLASAVLLWMDSRIAARPFQGADALDVDDGTDSLPFGLPGIGAAVVDSVPRSYDGALSALHPSLIAQYSGRWSPFSGVSAYGAASLDVWHCRRVPSSHSVCGNAGTLSFSAPFYAVYEGDAFLRVIVKRSGGGLGRVSVSYRLEHVTTDDADVHLTAPYTSSVQLVFEPGVVQLSFLISILDDRSPEGLDSILSRSSVASDLSPDGSSPSSYARNPSPWDQVARFVSISNNGSMLNAASDPASSGVVVDASTGWATFPVRLSPPAQTQQPPPAASGDPTLESSRGDVVDASAWLASLGPNEYFRLRLVDPCCGAVLGMQSVVTVAIIDDDGDSLSPRHSEAFGSLTLPLPARIDSSDPWRKQSATQYTEAWWTTDNASSVIDFGRYLAADGQANPSNPNDPMLLSSSSSPLWATSNASAYFMGHGRVAEANRLGVSASQAALQSLGRGGSTVWNPTSQTVPRIGADLAAAVRSLPYATAGSTTKVTVAPFDMRGTVLNSTRITRMYSGSLQSPGNGSSIASIIGTELFVVSLIPCLDAQSLVLGSPATVVPTLTAGSSSSSGDGTVDATIQDTLFRALATSGNISRPLSTRTATDESGFPSPLIGVIGGGRADAATFGASPTLSSDTTDDAFSSSMGAFTLELPSALQDAFDTFRATDAKLGEGATRLFGTARLAAASTFMSLSASNSVSSMARFDPISGTYTAKLTPVSAGPHAVIVQHAAPGGLLGSYYANSELDGPPVVRRVDAGVMFRWSFGPLFSLGRCQETQVQDSAEGGAHFSSSAPPSSFSTLSGGSVGGRSSCPARADGHGASGALPQGSLPSSLPRTSASLLSQSSIVEAHEYSDVAAGNPLGAECDNAATYAPPTRANRCSAAAYTDQVSIRWTGKVRPDRSTGGTGLYDFVLIADDGVRLWIDGQLVIDAWDSPSSYPARDGTAGSQAFFSSDGAGADDLLSLGSRIPAGPEVSLMGAATIGVRQRESMQAQIQPSQVEMSVPVRPPFGAEESASFSLQQPDSIASLLTVSGMGGSSSANSTLPSFSDLYNVFGATVGQGARETVCTYGRFGRGSTPLLQTLSSAAQRSRGGLSWNSYADLFCIDALSMWRTIGSSGYNESSISEQGMSDPPISNYLISPRDRITGATLDAKTKSTKSSFDRLSRSSDARLRTGYSSISDRSRVGLRASLALRSGYLHDIVLEYRDLQDYAVCELMWVTPSAKLAEAAAAAARVLLNSSASTSSTCLNSSSAASASSSTVLPVPVPARVLYTLREISMTGQIPADIHIYSNPSGISSGGVQSWNASSRQISAPSIHSPMIRRSPDMTYVHPGGAFASGATIFVSNGTGAASVFDSLFNVSAIPVPSASYCHTETANAAMCACPSASALPAFGGSGSRRRETVLDSIMWKLLSASSTNSTSSGSSSVGQTAVQADTRSMVGSFATGCGLLGARTGQVASFQVHTQDSRNNQRGILAAFDEVISSSVGILLDPLLQVNFQTANATYRDPTTGSLMTRVGGGVLIASIPYLAPRLSAQLPGLAKNVAVSMVASVAPFRANSFLFANGTVSRSAANATSLGRATTPVQLRFNPRAGIFDASWSPHFSGVHMLSVILGYNASSTSSPNATSTFRHVSGSPYAISSSALEETDSSISSGGDGSSVGIVSPRNSIVTGPGIHPMGMGTVAGTPRSIWIQPRDEFGNPILTNLPLPGDAGWVLDEGSAPPVSSRRLLSLGLSGYSGLRSLAWDHPAVRDLHWSVKATLVSPPALEPTFHTSSASSSSYAVVTALALPVLGLAPSCNLGGALNNRTTPSGSQSPTSRSILGTTILDATPSLKGSSGAPPSCGASSDLIGIGSYAAGSAITLRNHSYVILLLAVYVPTLSGNYSISIEEGSSRRRSSAAEPVSQSPYTTYVPPGPTDGSSCTLQYVPYWQQTGPAMAVLTLRDEYGNVRSEKSQTTIAPADDNVTVLVSSSVFDAFGARGVTRAGLATYAGDGLYNVTMPCAGLDCAVWIWVQSKLIWGAPFSFTRMALSTNASTSNAWGPGLTMTTVGTPSWALIQTRDSDGNLRRRPSAAPINVIGGTNISLLQNGLLGTSTPSGLVPPPLYCDRWQCLESAAAASSYSGMDALRLLNVTSASSNATSGDSRRVQAWLVRLGTLGVDAVERGADTAGPASVGFASYHFSSFLRTTLSATGTSMPIVPSLTQYGALGLGSGMADNGIPMWSPLGLPTTLSRVLQAGTGSAVDNHLAAPLDTRPSATFSNAPAIIDTAVAAANTSFGAHLAPGPSNAAIIGTVPLLPQSPFSSIFRPPPSGWLLHPNMSSGRDYKGRSTGPVLPSAAVIPEAINTAVCPFDEDDLLSFYADDDGFFNATLAQLLFGTNSTPSSPAMTSRFQSLVMTVSALNGTDGLVLLSYEPKRSGLYAAIITIDGIPIPSSQTLVAVLPAAFDATESDLSLASFPEALLTGMRDALRDFVDSCATEEAAKLSRSSLSSSALDVFSADAFIGMASSDPTFSDDYLVTNITLNETISFGNAISTSLPRVTKACLAQSALLSTTSFAAALSSFGYATSSVNTTLQDSIASVFYPKASSILAGSKFVSSLRTTAGVPIRFDSVLRDAWGNRVLRSGIDGHRLSASIIGPASPLSVSSNASAATLTASGCYLGQAAASSLISLSESDVVPGAYLGSLQPTFAGSYTISVDALPTGYGFRADYFASPDWERDSYAGSRYESDWNVNISAAAAMGASSVNSKIASSSAAPSFETTSPGSIGLPGLPLNFTASDFTALWAATSSRLSVSSLVSVRKYGYFRPVFNMSSNDFAAMDIAGENSTHGPPLTPLGTIPQLVSFIAQLSSSVEAPLGTIAGLNGRMKVAVLEQGVSQVTAQHARYFAALAQGGITSEALEMGVGSSSNSATGDAASVLGRLLLLANISSIGSTHIEQATSSITMDPGLFYGLVVEFSDIPHVHTTGWTADAKASQQGSVFENDASVSNSDSARRLLSKSAAFSSDSAMSSSSRGVKLTVVSRSLNMQSAAIFDHDHRVGVAVGSDWSILPTSVVASIAGVSVATAQAVPVPISPPAFMLYPPATETVGHAPVSLCVEPTIASANASWAEIPASLSSILPHGDAAAAAVLPALVEARLQLTLHDAYGNTALNHYGAWAQGAAASSSRTFETIEIPSSLTNAPLALLGVLSFSSSRSANVEFLGNFSAYWQTLDSAGIVAWALRSPDANAVSRMTARRNVRLGHLPSGASASPPSQIELLASRPALMLPPSAFRIAPADSSSSSSPAGAWNLYFTPPRSGRYQLFVALLPPPSLLHALRVAELASRDIERSLSSALLPHPEWKGQSLRFDNATMSAKTLLVSGHVSKITREAQNCHCLLSASNISGLGEGVRPVLSNPFGWIDFTAVPSYTAASGLNVGLTPSTLWNGSSSLSFSSTATLSSRILRPLDLLQREADVVDTALFISGAAPSASPGMTSSNPTADAHSYGDPVAGSVAGLTQSLYLEIVDADGTSYFETADSGEYPLLDAWNASYQDEQSASSSPPLSTFACAALARRSDPSSSSLNQSSRANPLDAALDESALEALGNTSISQGCSVSMGFSWYASLPFQVDTYGPFNPQLSSPITKSLPPYVVNTPASLVTFSVHGMSGSRSNVKSDGASALQSALGSSLYRIDFTPTAAGLYRVLPFITNGSSVQPHLLVTSNALYPLSPATSSQVGSSPLILRVLPNLPSASSSTLEFSYAIGGGDSLSMRQSFSVATQRSISALPVATQDFIASSLPYAVTQTPVLIYTALNTSVVEFQSLSIVDVQNFASPKTQQCAGLLAGSSAASSSSSSAPATCRLCNPPAKLHRVSPSATSRFAYSPIVSTSKWDWFISALQMGSYAEYASVITNMSASQQQSLLSSLGGLNGGGNVSFAAYFDYTQVLLTYYDAYRGGDNQQCCYDASHGVTWSSRSAYADISSTSNQSSPSSLASAAGDKALLESPTPVVRLRLRDEFGNPHTDSAGVLVHAVLMPAAAAARSHARSSLAKEHATDTSWIEVDPFVWPQDGAARVLISAMKNVEGPTLAAAEARATSSCLGAASQSPARIHTGSITSDANLLTFVSEAPESISGASATTALRVWALDEKNGSIALPLPRITTTVAVWTQETLAQIRAISANASLAILSKGASATPLDAYPAFVAAIQDVLSRASLLPTAISLLSNSWFEEILQAATGNVSPSSIGIDTLLDGSSPSAALSATSRITVPAAAAQRLADSTTSAWDASPPLTQYATGSISALLALQPDEATTSANSSSSTTCAGATGTPLRLNLSYSVSAGRSGGHLGVPYQLLVRLPKTRIGAGLTSRYYGSWDDVSRASAAAPLSPLAFTPIADSRTSPPLPVLVCSQQPLVNYSDLWSVSSHCNQSIASLWSRAPFGAIITGYIRIPVDATYSFQLECDGPCELQIDGMVVLRDTHSDQALSPEDIRPTSRNSSGSIILRGQQLYSIAISAVRPASARGQALASGILRLMWKFDVGTAYPLAPSVTDPTQTTSIPGFPDRSDSKSEITLQQYTNPTVVSAVMAQQLFDSAYQSQYINGAKDTAGAASKIEWPTYTDWSVTPTSMLYSEGTLDFVRGSPVPVQVLF